MSTTVRLSGTAALKNKLIFGSVSLRWDESIRPSSQRHV
jgi:hypothetical protein